MIQRRFFSILAAAGLLLLVLQLVDLAPMLTEADLATAAGRVRVVTLLQGRAFPILLADVSLVWTTVALSRGGAVRVIGALHLMLGALMVVVAPFFWSTPGAWPARSQADRSPRSGSSWRGRWSCWGCLAGAHWWPAA